jgi:hypothetical protein
LFLHDAQVGQKESSYRDYFLALSRAKYLIVPYVNRMSAGQTASDAACFNLPTLGYSHKFLQRLLHPPFLLWRTHDELFQKIEMMDNNFTLYEEMVQDVSRRSRYFDIQSLPSAQQVLDWIHIVSNDTRCYF